MNEPDDLSHYMTSCSRLKAENAHLQEQLAVAQRLLNFTPDQLELLVDPEKLAYVTWNLSCTYTLQLMCKTYREGKIEVRHLQERVEETERRNKLMEVNIVDALNDAARYHNERDEARALAERRKKAGQFLWWYGHRYVGDIEISSTAAIRSYGLAARAVIEERQ